MLWVESRSWRGVLDTTLWDENCQWLAVGQWFSPVSAPNKTDCHNITEILLKIELNTVIVNPIPMLYCISFLTWHVSRGNCYRSLIYISTYTVTTSSLMLFKLDSLMRCTIWYDISNKVFSTTYHRSWFFVCLFVFIGGGGVMVFNATFNNISVILRWSVLLLEETELPWDNTWPAASHWQTLSHNVVCETKFCGIIDQSLFYIDLIVHYMQNFENLTQTWFYRHCL